MARLQRPGLEHGGHLRMMLCQHVEHFGQGNRAVADRAAHETEAFVGELRAIVLQMDVADMRARPAG